MSQTSTGRHKRRVQSVMKKGLKRGQFHGFVCTPRSARPVASGFRSFEDVEGLWARLEFASSDIQDWTTSIRRILEVDAEVLQVERVSFWLWDETRRLIRCDQGYVASTRLWERGATLMRKEAHAYFDALLDARILVLDDVYADARTRALRPYCEARNITSMLNVPVWTEGRMVGVLCHEHVGRRRNWSSSEAEFAVGATHALSSRMSARERERAQAEASRIAFLDELSRLALRSLDRRELSAQAVALLARRLSPYAGIHVVGGDGRLENVAVSYPPQQSSAVERLLRLAGEPGQPPGLAERAIRCGQSLLLREITPAILERYGLTSPLRTAILELGLRTALAVPLHVGGRAFAALVLFATDRTFDDEDLALAEQVGERLSAALENAKAYERVREAVRLREDFLVLVSHELRTPLASLQLVLDRRMRRGQAGDADPNLDWDQKANRQVRKLTRLVERMLEAVRIQSDGLALRLEPHNLGEVVVAAIGALQQHEGIVLRLEPDIMALVDSAYLMRVVEELVDNALKFGGEQPVTVVLRCEGQEAVLSIEDRGGGIPAERISSIFSLFERAGSNAHYGGLGLGLFISKTVVEGHGGSIQAVTRPGAGATLIVRLPIRQRDAAIAKAAPAIAPHL